MPVFFSHKFPSFKACWAIANTGWWSLGLGRQSYCRLLFSRKVVSNSAFFSHCHFSSVAQSWPTLCNPMNRSTPGLCPSPTPGVHSDSHPSSRWCHPAISSSVIPFSSCPQSLPASESFPKSQLFAWGGQSTVVSALASFLPKNTQGWSPLVTVEDNICSPRLLTLYIE